MRPPPDSRPSVGALAPKGMCRWLSPFGGCTVWTAFNYNYHRAAGRILCRRLKYATGPLSLRFDPPPFQSHVPPQNVKNKKPKIQVYMKTSEEVRDFYLVKFTLALIFQIGR
ncbi:unnamed protein product [Brassica rapa]|uniref:Uncharacterized protein n=1 Tax=Brassica campestris TaxID=3711 RepID=A0A8D9D885_BRACM|nr:unnamed protein product [Brassica rapa]